jgi:hypothetical protein
MLAAELHEAIHDPGDLDEGIRDLGKAIVAAYKEWARGRAITSSVRKSYKKKLAQDFVKSHPELARRSVEARRALGGWDRFKAQYNEVMHALGNMGSDIFDVLQGLPY